MEIKKIINVLSVAGALCLGLSELLKRLSEARDFQDLSSKGTENSDEINEKN